MSIRPHLKRFGQALAERNPDPGDRDWILVPLDQLTDTLGPLAQADPRTVGIVVVEAWGRWRKLPFHRQKVALELANLRHFALEQAERGVAVLHVAGEGTEGEALNALLTGPGDEHGDEGSQSAGKSKTTPGVLRTGRAPGLADTPLRLMEPAERWLRTDLAHLAETQRLRFQPHEGWLTSEEDFRKGAGDGPPWRMDAFYRYVRQRTGILMEDGAPVGGKYSFDADNREPWKGEPSPAVPPTFDPDPVTLEVLDLVEAEFGDHPGRLDGGSLPATAADADHLWTWARQACLPHFGPHEDAMSTASTTLFHTRVSPLLNLHRLTPARLIQESVELEIPLQGKEGFVRQILGWREFVRHVHRATDGFRSISGGDRIPNQVPERNGDAAPSFLGANRPLPPVYWGDTPSGLHCLDHVVDSVWQEGWSHHITRLMILSNLATLLDVDPRELTDWFWAAYTDAWDWVVEPNVLAMGTFAVGELMTTKPYVSGTPYIHRMSDYCDACALDPKETCPISELYWAFLARHRERLEGNRRMALPLASAEKRTADRRSADARVFQAVEAALSEGREVTVELVEEARQEGE